MPITIQKPALRDFHAKVTADPHTKVDDLALDKIVAIVGDKTGFMSFFGVTTDQLAKRLSTTQLTRAEKVEMARNGLDAGEKQDLIALVADPMFAQKLDAGSLNFINAIIGRESLLATGGRAAPVEVKADHTKPEVQAADKLRALIKSGELSKYYDAVIGAVDNPTLKAEAMALFSALPVVKTGMAPDDFVRAGLWTHAPVGVDQMQKSARYLPGRQVLVETTLKSKVPNRSSPDYEKQRREIGEYDPHGVTAVTHRATLVGQDPANPNAFLVKIDGSDKPISIAKTIIYKHNQPHELAANNIKSDTKRDIPWGGRWHVDYADPLAKAKLAEIAIKMDAYVSKLDFSRPKGEAELQKSCVDVVFRSIDMKYPKHDGTPFTDPGRATSGESDVARQAIKGTGMCVQQSCVFGALLMPFMDVLGVDGQYRSGNCYRNIRGATDNVFAPDNESGHGWWQVTFRPSMEMTVTDRTWDQVNLTLDRAYGFPYGDRYADTDIYGYVSKKLSDTDVNVTGAVTVETRDRQFSQVGDGREHHIGGGN